MSATSPPSPTSKLHNDIFAQARAGSITAMIQILNERLADAGVRTRAMMADGLLHVLCEATTAEQLDEGELVPRIQRILEGVSPRNIRRAKLYSRLTREQEVLWLDAITQDPDGHLLWSQVISLAQPSLFKRWVEDRQRERSRTKAAEWEAPPQSEAKSQKRVRLGLGVAGLLFLGALGLIVIDRLGWLPQEKVGALSNAALQGPSAGGEKPGNPVETLAQPAAQTAAQSAAQTTATPSVAAQPVAASAKAATEPFVEAVRLAEQTAIAGTKATTKAEWLALAAGWQQAADLMAQVATSDPRYATAQNRVQTYQANSAAALKKAEQF